MFYPAVAGVGLHFARNLPAASPPSLDRKIIVPQGRKTSGDAGHGGGRALPARPGRAEIASTEDHAHATAGIRDSAGDDRAGKVSCVRIANGWQEIILPDTL